MAAIFPGAVATQLQLLTALNNAMIVLDVDCDIDDDTINVDDASPLPESGYLTFVDTDEVIYYTAKTGTTLTGVIRGADGTTPSAHIAGVDLEQRWNADYHNILTLEMLAIETYLSDRFGIGSSPVVPSTKTLTLRATSNQLVLGTTNTVTISSTAPASSRTYTIPDAGGSANFLLSGWAQIVNADVNASAAIAYSKLSLTGGIVNADVNASAAIAYSKLSLTGSIVNADINASAAIAYSKLALTGAILNADLAGSIAYSKLSLTGAILNADLAGSIAYSKLTLTGAILNADINASAAIARSKLAALTASRAVVTDGSGFDAVATTTAIEIGYVNGVTSSIQTQLDARVLDTGDTITGDLTMDNQKGIKFREGSGGGTNNVYVRAGGNMASDYSILLPIAAPSANAQVMKVSDYTTGLLEWGTGGGQGGINYITNYDAETDASVWTTYADAAATTPVDGTGGSPSATFARNTSSPLRGTGMFTLTKGATNRQGDGVGYAFTIDAADKASVQQISFDYQGSASWVGGDSSDVRIFIYDVTNSLLIVPAPYTLQGATGGPRKFVSTFQTASNSTSYRLIFHIATTNASAWTFDFDNVKVGPQLSVWGAPVSDWVTYTSTFANVGTVANNEMRYRRVGDTLHVLGTVQVGTVAGSTFSLTIPSGLAIDYSKVPSATGSILTVGKWYGYQTGGLISSSAFGPLFVDGSDTTHLFAALNANSNVLSKANGNAVAAASNYMSFEFVVPISGWASNVQMSNDTDTRVVAARYYSVAQSFTGSLATLNCGTKDFDTHGAYSAGVFTCPVSGVYRVSTAISISAATTATLSNGYAGYLVKNGSLINSLCSYFFTTTGTTANAQNINGSELVYCNAGDTLAVQIIKDTNAGASTTSASQSTWVSFERLSGPSTIAATELVACRYEHRAGVAVSAGVDLTVAFATKDFDTHGAFSSDTFTAPVSGTYHVQSAISTTGIGYTAGDQCYIGILKNGTAHAEVFDAEATQVNGHVFKLFDTVRLLPGDTIKIKINSPRAGNLTSVAGRAYVCITRVGNY